jgi:hypothetical protein
MDGPDPVVWEVGESHARECNHPRNKHPTGRVQMRGVAVCLLLLVWGRVPDPSAERMLGDSSAAGPAASFSTLNRRGNPAHLPLA